MNIGGSTSAPGTNADEATSKLSPVLCLRARGPRAGSGRVCSSLL